MGRASNLIAEFAGDNKVINERDYRKLLEAGVSPDKIKSKMDKGGYTLKGNFNPAQTLAISNLNQATPNAAKISNDLLKMSNNPVQYTTQQVANPKYKNNERTPFEDRYNKESVVNFDYYTSNPEYMKYFDGKSFDSVNDIVNTNMAIQQARD